jgi:acetyl-CoA carboxylase biotin carboxyl carrier protein
MNDVDTGGGAPDKNTTRSVWEEARDLIKRLEGSTVQRLRIEDGELTIEIERGVPAAGAAAQPGMARAASGALAMGEDVLAAEPDNRQSVVAPLVGTFYRAPEPGSRPFVEEGDIVDEGQTVAIVEAMKLMNQVKADQGGRVAEIVVGDGSWVEFEQVLMYLEPVGD